jgi:polysaccharide pyruvyl transferase WcaK-like protein
MSILFTGYYGQLNTGDDIFGVVADWGARKFWHQNKIHYFGENLPLKYNNKPLESSFITRNEFKGKEILEILPSCINYKNIIYAGGSIFHSKIKYISKNSILQNYKRAGFLNIGAIGVSLGPFQSKKDYESIKKYLKKFSFLGLRDKRSYLVASEMKLNIPIVEAFDFAALLPYIYPINKTNNNKPVLGISICNYERYKNGDIKNEKRRFQKIVQSINLLLMQVPNLKIKVFIFNAHSKFGDIDISRKLIKNIPKNIDIETVDYNKNPYLMWNEISSCNAVLATRLHAGMFSYFTNTPFLQIEYHKKCQDFLEVANYPEKYKIGDIELSANKIAAKLNVLLKKPEINLFSESKKLQEKALLNFTEFKHLI